MKFTISRSDFLGVLSKIQGLTSRKSNLAITANVLIRTTDSGVVISATDLETGFEGFYNAVVESEGIIALNAKKLFEIVKDFPDDEIIINEIENRWIEISSENIEFHIVGMNHDDFPEIPHVEDAQFFEMKSSTFKNMIEKTIFITAAGDEKRAHIIGVNFERREIDDEKTVRMVSTDGKRLSLFNYEYDNSDLDFIPGETVLVPKKGLSEVHKFLDTENIIKIGIKDNRLIIQKENEIIIINLLEGDFPEYDDIINRDEDTIVRLERKYFLMMLKRMSILSSDDYRGVIFNFLKDKLIIRATNPELGESKEEMSIVYDRKPFEVAFNPKFFIDTLNLIDDETVVLYIEDDETPCNVQGGEDHSYLSVIMPMKI